MKIALKDVLIEELSFKHNYLNIKPGDKIVLEPQITFRPKNGKVNGDDKIRLLAFSMKIESTEENPKPFDLKISVAGVFETEFENPEEERDLPRESSKLLYPYFRSEVLNFTSKTIGPLRLPLSADQLFASANKEPQESKDKFAFVVDNSKLN